MPRILLLSGTVLSREVSLRRRLLRFTGSRRATRILLRRIAEAQRLGQIMSCMIVPRLITKTRADTAWEVRFSFTDPAIVGGLHA